MEDGNFKTALRLICSDDTPAIPNAETREALQLKHASKPPDRRDPPQPKQGATQTPLTMTSETVMTELQSFPVSSSDGPDGLTPQHLKDLVSNNTSSELLEALTSLVNLILGGAGAGSQKR